MASGPPILVERIARALRSGSAPRSTGDLARQFLGVGLIDEQLAERLLGAVLAEDPRFVRFPEGWSVRERSGDWDGPHLAEPWVAAFAPRAPSIAALAPSLTVVEPAYSVAAGGEGEVRRAEARLVRRLPRPAVDLARVCRRLRGYAGPATPVRLAEAIGAPHVESDSPAGAAGVAAAVWERLAGELALEGVADLAELDRLLEVRLERADLTGREFDRESLAALPDGPGVYLFLDAAGQALYVGQSQTLATRVASYFVGPPRDEKDRTLRALAVRLITRSVDAPPDALLLEARWIRRRAPSLNTRRAAHGSAAEDGLLAVRTSAPRPRIVLYVLRSGGLVARGAAAPGSKRCAAVVERMLAALFARRAASPDCEAGVMLDAWRRMHPEAPFLRPALDGGPAHIRRAVLGLAAPC